MINYRHTDGSNQTLPNPTATVTTAIPARPPGPEPPAPTLRPGIGTIPPTLALAAAVRAAPAAGRHDCTNPGAVAEARSPRSGARSPRSRRRSRRTAYRSAEESRRHLQHHRHRPGPRRHQQSSPMTARRSRPSTGPTGRGTEFPPGHMAVFAAGPVPQDAHQPGHRREDVLRARQRGDGRGHRVLVPEVQVRLRPADHRHPRAVQEASTSTRGWAPTRASAWSWARTGCPTRRSTWSPRRSPSTCRVTAPSPRPGATILVGVHRQRHLRRERHHPGRHLLSKIEPDIPAKPVTLSWPTLHRVANDAGMSRRYGRHPLQERRHTRSVARQHGRPGRLVQGAVLLQRYHRLRLLTPHGRSERRPAPGWPPLSVLPTCSRRP